MADGHLVVSDLTVRRGDTLAVAGLDLDLAPGSFTALLGPSGCGKSTTLAALAGLVTIDNGAVTLDGVALTTTPPERRPVSLVLQKPLLFPHLSVAQNVAFGLRMARVPRAEIRERVAEMLTRVRLEGLVDRRPDQLSGGQEQRVALARALVRRPRVLLLDEPFSALDAGLRAEMRGLVRALHDEQEVTTLFVTHDRDEAVEVADRIVLLQAGRCVGAGTPEECYMRPATLALADFFGWTGRLTGTVEGGRFVAPGLAPLVVAEGTAPGAGVLVVRPEAVALGAGAWRLPVASTRFAGTHVAVELTLPDASTLLARVPVGSAPVAGDVVSVSLPSERCVVVARRDDAT